MRFARNLPMQTTSSGDCGFVFPTEMGWMAIAWRGTKVRQLTFGHPSAAAALASLEAPSLEVVGDRRALPEWIVTLVNCLEDYALGQDVSFDRVPVDVGSLTEFQQRVVRECRKIRRGQTRTYSQLAAAAGSPGASRAVGNVMARNKLPILIPCHRVVGAGCSLGGFSAPDGLSMKQRMLRMEGAALATQLADRPRTHSPTRRPTALAR
jgi:methylated-DNA-[protein]-cysteine S-methyltransferase